jgi:transposase
MSVLDRIDKLLLAWLRERYPVETVPMLGECVIVPTKRLPQEFEQKLKQDGVRIRYQGYDGETCAFIALEKQAQSVSDIEDSSIQKEDSEHKPDSDSKPSPELKPWTPEERETMKNLLKNGASPKAIAEKLGKSIFQIAAMTSHLPDDFKPKRGRQPKVNTETPIQERKEEKPQPKSDGHSEDFREMMESCLLLYNSGKKRACMILLSEANRLLEKTV